VTQENIETNDTASELQLVRQAIVRMRELSNDERFDRRTEILCKRPSGVPEHVYSLNLARVVIV